MPRWASRLDVENKGVRIERLQDISMNECLLGGAKEFAEMYHVVKTPKNHYREIWDSIHKKHGHGWNTNPYVWILDLGRVER